MSSIFRRLSSAAHSALLLKAPSSQSSRKLSRMTGTLRPRSSDSLPQATHPEKKRRLSIGLNDDAPHELVTSTVDDAQSSSTTIPAAAPEKKKMKDPRWLAKKKKQKLAPEPCSPEDVLLHDIYLLLGRDVVDKLVDEGKEFTAPFGFREEVILEVEMVGSNGEGFARAPAPHPPWIVIVPFALPGEKVRARVYRNARLHSLADLISVERPNLGLRDMSRVQCRYFGRCAGCQYQMLSYDIQLEWKRNVIVKAFQHFSGLPSTSIPTIGSTFPSPLQYGYRTKITPHFEAPPKKLQKEGLGEDHTQNQPPWLRIGFNEIGKRTPIDIEECPIATPVLNEALGPLRQKIIQNIHTYKKGVSLLLRESTDTLATSAAPPASDVDDLSGNFEKHFAVTDHRKTVRERVAGFLFEYPGGSFFQNNNSVLEPLTSYVRDAIILPTSVDSSVSPPTHLVDAYCGAGLFAITLSPHFEKAVGIELASDSIRAATSNALLNNIPEAKLSFRAGDAADIFSVVSATNAAGEPEFPRDRTALIIDPPRKGSDERFIDQMLQFGCGTVVYVSCNVHTQARDLGMILRKSDDVSSTRVKYKIESIRGFDLFPQTAHVESVAVLRRDP